jgi:abortive infection bacteriophage resistance protein
MEFTKAAITLEAQADLLLSRGLVADRAQLITRLQSVSYYRLSGYAYPFRIPGTDNLQPGTNFDTIWQRYCFDRRLRVLLLDAIERIEVAVRTRLVYHFAQQHGPFGYLHAQHFPKLEIGTYLEWRLKLHEETNRSKEVFKKAFFTKYTAHTELPLWMVAELMSMGSVLTFLKGVAPQIKQAVGAPEHLPDTLLLSWFTSLNAARNMCAHHARLSNRELGYQPLLPQPNKFPLWHGEHKIPNHRCGILLFICRYWLGLISPSSHWPERVGQLFTEYPGQSRLPTWVCRKTGGNTQSGINLARPDSLRLQI